MVKVEVGIDFAQYQLVFNGEFPLLYLFILLEAHSKGFVDFIESIGDNLIILAVLFPVDKLIEIVAEDAYVEEVRVNEDIRVF